MATGKRGPHKPRKPIVTEWTAALDARIRRHDASGMNATAISEATGIAPRTIIARLRVLRGGGASSDVRRKFEDPYGLRTPDARRAEANVEAGLLEAARDDTLEWRAWESVHILKLPAKTAARNLGIALPDLWDALARQKAVLVSKSLA